MANYAHTKDIIAQNIYTNHEGRVTAEMVKTAANEIVDTLIAGGYLYAGVAHPGDAAVSPDANVFYIATEAGTYTNKGGLVVADGEVAIFKFNGTWSKEVTGAATAAQVTELGQEIKPIDVNVVSLEHIPFILVANEVYTLKNNTENSIDLYLRVDKNSTGQKLITLSGGRERTIQEATQYNYLYYYAPSSPGEIVNITITKAGNITQQVLELNEKVNDNADNIIALNREIVKKTSFTLAGTSESKIVLNKPIHLSQDGDEIEILVTTQLEGNYEYSFAKTPSGSTYGQSICISKNKIGLRASGAPNNGWLIDASVPNPTGTILYKLFYSNSKMYLYVNGTLRMEKDTQYPIDVASFGDGAGGAYGYWSGRIVYVKVNGVSLVQSEVKTYNVIVENEYNFNDIPVGLLEYHYDSVSPYFMFYSNKKGTNKYFAFKVALSVDTSDEVYLKEWRLAGGGLYQYDNGVFTLLSNTIYDLENEMAMHFVGAVDYTGGVHGDERIDIDNTCFAKFFADGKAVVLSSYDFSIECEEFLYCQKSTLHQSAGTGQEYVPGHPIIAFHYKRNCFKDCGFELKNNIVMSSAQSVNVCHAGMMCVAKDAADYAILPNMVATPHLTGTNTEYHADNLKQALVDMWNGTNNIRCTVEGHFIDGYNDLTDIDQLMVWDRSTDSKYYRRSITAHAFSANDVISNTQKVQYN